MFLALISSCHVLVFCAVCGDKLHSRPNLSSDEFDGGNEERKLTQKIVALASHRDCEMPKNDCCR